MVQCSQKRPHHRHTDYRYADLVHFTALNVATLYQGVPSSILLQSHTDEHLLVYERYSSAVCNVIAMSAFVQIARLVDIPQRLTACFADRLPSRKTSPESLLTFAFLSPLGRIAFYKMMLSRGSLEASCEVQRWEVFSEAQEAARKQAEATRIFWESSGRLVETLRTPQRRLLRDSKTHALTLHNASRFSNHWLILLSDAFVHISGATQTVHSLDTLWVEPMQDTDNLQNGLLITTPEDSLQLIAPSAHEKVDWIIAFQDALKKRLNRNPVPTVRTATYTFTKHATYKDATYSGRWVSGKLEGKGRLDWPDGKLYVGAFRCSQPHGHGRMHTPSLCEYDGQWRDGLQNGYGCTKYNNGDVYEGYYKDGLACGYGTFKSGHFMTNSAYTYCGEWVSGQKQGYGVMDDITTGEKYMGCWNNNMRNGNGLIITRDGIYYEGIFSQNELTGQALMIFEDGALCGLEMKSAGVLNGKGTMVFACGDRLEGSMHGQWSEGLRVTGTFHKVACLNQLPPPTKREKPKNERIHIVSMETNFLREAKNSQMERMAALTDELLTGKNKDILKAFGSSYHPLGVALTELSKAYNNTYSLSNEHSHLLLQHAVHELHSIIERLYQAVRVLLPALPAPGVELPLSDNEPCEVASMATVLHPEILPRVCSGLFDLYTHDNQQENEAFRKRLLELNQYSDETLMSFLDIERKLWINNNGELHEQPFSLAIVTLQHLKTTFIPLEKFMVLRETFERMKEEVRIKLGEDYLWTTDRIIPLLEFVIVRSQILQLESEVKFMSDFMEERFKLGEFNYHFTNLNACYKHILEEKKSVVMYH
ncbi:hypothetical protein LSTR_LSTR008707 [Laodelphax striatellus]|uniref:VPS9 domain-containing protein n=1 Tax=Laodelphax striatellus TaxID=195883 RepID=A0A482WHL1_LAOST|nr:hypothetical protein LSTR_LSTR008707 [Laodelphax striatellus]